MLKFYYYIYLAYLGKRIWKKISKSLTENDMAIFLPESNPEINQECINSLKPYLKKNNKNRFFVFYYDAKIKKMIKEIEDSDSFINSKRLSKRQIKNIIKLYEFNNFDNRILIGSLRFPNGRNGFLLLDVNNISSTDLIKQGIFNLENF